MPIVSEQMLKEIETVAATAGNLHTSKGCHDKDDALQKYYDLMTPHLTLSILFDLRDEHECCERMRNYSLALEKKLYNQDVEIAEKIKEVIELKQKIHRLENLEDDGIGPD